MKTVISTGNRMNVYVVNDLHYKSYLKRLSKLHYILSLLAFALCSWEKYRSRSGVFLFLGLRALFLFFRILFRLAYVREPFK